MFYTKLNLLKINSNISLEIKICLWKHKLKASIPLLLISLQNLELKNCSYMEFDVVENKKRTYLNQSKCGIKLWYQAKLESWAVHSLNSITIVFFFLFFFELVLRFKS